MFAALETLTVAGHHPDAGAWPLLLAVTGMAIVVVVARVRR
jgi:hypothetical protein